MALESIAGLGLGKVTHTDRRGAGNHSVVIEVTEKKRDNASLEVVKYLSSQAGIQLNSLRYNPENGKMIISYHDPKEAKSKARGSPGCGNDMFPYLKR